jgi:hypothetical protein
MNAESVLTLLKDKETVLELRKDGNALAMDWAVLGPLDLTIIPPKSELRINAQYPKYDGASEDELLRWNTIQDVRHTKPDTLKFNPYLNIREIIVAPAAVYLMTYVNLPKKTNVKMVIGGSNKIVKVWVNDQPLQAKDKSKKLFSAQLRKGKNEVVIEAWVAVDISLRVTDIRGVPIPGLSYSCPLSEDYSTD